MASSVVSDLVSDAELTALALAADLDSAVDDDAVSLWDLPGSGADGLLPEWYMPTPMNARPFHGWRRRLVRWTVFLIIASFVAINAYGLCNTYGQLSFG